MKKNNNILDEMQERKLLEIESRGYTIALWGLLAIYIVQMVLGCDFKQYGPELVLFLIICIYSTVASMKNNIWDRKLNPDPATNAIISIVAAGVSGIVMGAKVYNNFPDKIVGAIASGVFMVGMVFALCFGILTLLSGAYKAKVKKMEEAPEEE